MVEVSVGFRVACRVSSLLKDSWARFQGFALGSGIRMIRAHEAVRRNTAPRHWAKDVLLYVPPALSVPFALKRFGCPGCKAETAKPKS